MGALSTEHCLDLRVTSPGRIATRITDPPRRGEARECAAPQIDLRPPIGLPLAQPQSFREATSCPLCWPSIRAPRRSRAIVFRRRHLRSPRSAQQEFPQHFPALRLGRARPGGHLDLDASTVCREALDDGRARAPTTSPPSASPTSARPPWSGTARTGQADPPRHRLAGPPHRRRLRQAEARRATSRRSRPRPACCSIPISPAPRSPGCSTTSRARAHAAERGELAVRHRRQLPALAADRRQGARHRRHQRLAHAAVRHPHRRLGRRAAARCFDVPRSHAAGGARLRRRLRRRPTPTLFGGADPDPRHRRRPAGGDHRPGLLRARHDQVHLRHRLLRAAQHRRRRRSPRRTGCSPPSPTSSTASAPTRWKARSSSPAPRCSGCATGCGIIEHGGRDRRARRRGRSRPGRLSGAGLRRPRRALLGSARARRAVRPDPQHRPRRDRARRAGRRLLPDPRSARGDARRLAGREGRQPCCASTAA